MKTQHFALGTTRNYPFQNYIPIKAINKYTSLFIYITIYPENHINNTENVIKVSLRCFLFKIYLWFYRGRIFV